MRTESFYSVANFHKGLFICFICDDEGDNEIWYGLTELGDQTGNVAPQRRDTGPRFVFSLQLNELKKKLRKRQKKHTQLQAIECIFA